MKALGFLSLLSLGMLVTLLEGLIGKFGPVKVKFAAADHK